MFTANRRLPPSTLPPREGRGCNSSPAALHRTYLLNCGSSMHDESIMNLHLIFKLPDYCLISPSHLQAYPPTIYPCPCMRLGVHPSKGVLASISLSWKIYTVAHKVNHGELLMCRNIFLQLARGLDPLGKPDVTSFVVIFRAWTQDCEIRP